MKTSDAKARGWLMGWGIDALLWSAGMLGLIGVPMVLYLSRISAKRPQSIFAGEYAIPPSWLGVTPLVMLGATLLLAIITRRTLGYLAAASLLLCIVFAGAWIRSHWQYDLITFWAPRPKSGETKVDQTYLDSNSGGLALSVRHRENMNPEFWARNIGWYWFPKPSTNADYPLRARGWSPPLNFWNRRGFDLQIRPEWGIRTKYEPLLFTIAAPYWILCVLCLPMPLLWSRAFLRRRLKESRRRGGLCPACGYDLRATPDRCPECGAIPAPRKS